MSKAKLDKLVAIADRLDRLGEHHLADRIDTIIHLAAENETIPTDSDSEETEYSKEEYQRLLANVFEHLSTIYFDTIPNIEYLAPFWETIKGAIESARFKSVQALEDKVKTFDFVRYREWIKELATLRKNLVSCRKLPMDASRVLRERTLLVLPLEKIIHQLALLYKDDQTLKALEDEWRSLLAVFDNVFEQTTAEIANIDLKRHI